MASKLLVPDHLVLGNGTESGQGLMVDYRHTDSGQTNPLDFSEHMLKSDTEKIGKYNAAVSRSGHRFMPIILDKFGNVLQKTRDMLFQMFFLMTDMTSQKQRLILLLPRKPTFG